MPVCRLSKCPEISFASDMQCRPQFFFNGGPNCHLPEEAHGFGRNRFGTLCRWV